MKPIRIIIIIVVVALFGYAGSKILSGKKETGVRRVQVPVVKIETPRVEEVIRTLTFTGDIKPRRQLTLYAKVGGTLEELRADVGDWVSAGQVLACLDTAELSRQVLQTAASFHNARATYNRAQDLRKNNLISQQEFDNAQASLEVADAAYQLASLKLGYTTIKAPFSGYVSKRFLDAGALISANSTPLYTIIDYDIVKVDVEAPERDVPQVQKGVEATLILDAYPGEKFVGRVTRRSEALDLNTRTMSVEIEAVNSDHRMKPGMFATAELILEKRPAALTIPVDAALKDNRGFYLWKITNGKSQKLRVQTGVIQRDRIEIISGMALTDSVAVLGFQALRDGGEVSVEGTGGGKRSADERSEKRRPVTGGGGR